MEYSHPCIKCGTVYTDRDPDAYYCPDCQAINKEIAEQINQKLKRSNRKEVVSPLQAYDAAPKVRGFIRASDLF